MGTPGARAALAYCGRRENLRRTVRIALVVGVILTLINQSGALFGGHLTAVTWIRCTLNFVVPFIVSNLGLLSGWRNSRVTQ
ncbi:MAG TPA: nitrate/nitrite transporter NrtS [Solirubrobacteraceae bacterium]|nr:nitrate/nitrite transporter NrtS [Solirubrobacteraceae bacterium]